MHEIRDAVQGLMPEIMEQLAGSDEPVEFYSNDPREAAFTRQATIKAQSIFWEDSRGWIAVHDAALHTLIGRIGVYKVYRKEVTKFMDHPFTGLPIEVVEQYGDQDNLALLTREDYYEDGRDPATGQPMSYQVCDCTVREYYIEVTDRIDAVDPALCFVRNPKTRIARSA
jgi:hypothetical protein